MPVTAQELGKSVVVREIAGGNGLHVDLDENGVLSLVLWGIDMDDDTVLFEAKLTPEQEHLIRNAEKVDAWKVDPGVPCLSCMIVQ